MLKEKEKPKAVCSSLGGSWLQKENGLRLLRIQG
jgi:hypothetical protein